jgi:uncharacterized protein (DUF2164 family)
MALIEFSVAEKERLTRELQTYLENELGVDLGRFDAEHLLDFFSEKMGTEYYNRGLFDAQAILEGRMDTIVEAISQLEKH